MSRAPSSPPRPRETDLYAPVKAYLEAQGYEVKSEITGADIVARRPDTPEEEALIVELKTGFTLTLLHQGIDRQRLTDWVYLAVPASPGRKALARQVALCRRLGLGLLTVRTRDGFVTPQCDPGPFTPRKVKPRQTRLLREFARREGDPNTGGTTRTRIVTAYRQDACRIAAHLAEHGPSRGVDIARATGIATATRMLAADHYGWFERLSRGLYALTPRGHSDLPPPGQAD